MGYFLIILGILADALKRTHKDGHPFLLALALATGAAVLRMREHKRQVSR